MLGVSPDAPDEVIRAAYRALATKYHPDRNPSDRDAELKLKRLNAAYAVLGEPGKRRLYDELTQSPQASDEPPPEPPRKEPPKAEQPRWKVPDSARPPTSASEGKGAQATLAVFLVLGAVIFWLSRQDSRDEKPGDHASTSTTAAPAVATATPAPTVPEVLPLLPGETPPSESPNYFEPREMSSGGIVVGLNACKDSAHKSDPTLGTDLISAYCACFTDAFRHNCHSSGDIAKATPTTDQAKRCAAAARSASPSPFGYASPRSTADVVKAWAGCVRVFGEKDHGGYCECFVDATLAALKNPQSELIAQPDQKRCEVADQYWAATRTHLTVRQFKALGAHPPPTPSPGIGGATRAAASPPPRTSDGQCNCNGDLVCQMNCSAPPSAALSAPPPAPTPKTGSDCGCNDSRFTSEQVSTCLEACRKSGLDR